MRVLPSRRPAIRTGATLVASTMVLWATVVASQSAYGEADSDAGRLHEISQARASFQERYADWLARLDLSPKSLAKMPHAQMMDQVTEPLPTLDAAVTAADLIIAGRVESFAATVHGSSVEVRVSNALKGEVGAVVSVAQAGTIVPRPDWSPSIADSTTGETLLPGMDVVLLLARDASTGNLYALPLTGQYRIEDGKARSTNGNPFGAEVNRLTVSEFGRLIAASTE